MRLIKKLIFVVLCLLMIFIGIMMTINNTDRVTIDLVFVQLPELSLGVWLLLTLLMGGVIGVLLSTMTMFMLRTRLGSVKRKLATTQKELDQLRVSTLKDAV